MIGVKLQGSSRACRVVTELSFIEHFLHSWYGSEMHYLRVTPDLHNNTVS